MRSKRVTKLLACVLSAAMCAGPTAVFAADVEYGEYDPTQGSITTDFGIASPELKVTVPIKASVKVNPLSENGSGVEQYGLASKDLIITNKTIKGTKPSDRDGADILVTVTGKVASGTGAKVFYEQDGFTPNGASKQKNLYMQLAAANLHQTVGTPANSLSENNVFTMAADNQPFTQTMTSVGSRIQFTVPGADKATAPSVSTGTLSAGDYNAGQVCGAFAVIGKANTGADWVANDMAIELKYEIKATTAEGIASPTVPTITVTSANGVSVNNFVMDRDLYGALITDIVLYDKTVDTPEGRWASDDPALTFTRNTNDDGYDFKISKDDPVIQYLNNLPAGSSKRTGKYFVLVKFSDGRVSRTAVTVS